MKKSAAVVALATSFMGGLVILAPQASAIGGNCSAWHQEREVNNAPNDWRVLASCSSLQADTKAKGVGSVSLIADHTTGWFTALNTTRSSSWGKGAIDSTRVELTRV